MLEHDYLCHYGILGMKWGIRRFQNSDGSLTPEGRERYGSGSVFISGSSKTQDKSSGYYRAQLPRGVRKKIDGYIKAGKQINVGDSPGIDRQVQEYLKSKGYKNVTVYGPGKQVRYAADSKWKTKPVDKKDAKEGSKEWLAEKDKAMERDSTEGLAVILPKGGAGATRNNVERLFRNGKGVDVYQLSDKSKIFDKQLSSEEVANINSANKRYGYFKDVNKYSSSNLSDWGKSSSKNILYVTGTSGSGKSSLAGFLGDDGKTQVIFLDSYLSPMSKQSRNDLQNKDFNAFLEDRGIDYNHVIKKNGKLDFGIVDQIAKASESYGKQNFKKGEKVIIEGVQLFDNTLYPDRSAYKDKPVIALRTSSLKSNYRGSNRDSDSKFDLISLMAYRLPMTINTNKLVKSFEKELGLKKADESILDFVNKEEAKKKKQRSAEMSRPEVREAMRIAKAEGWDALSQHQKDLLNGLD